MSRIDELRRALEGDASIRLAVLFGSAARGLLRDDSDLDVGVLGVPGDRLSTLQLTLERAAQRPVDLVALEASPPLLRFEIAREGKVLIERSSRVWSEFKAHAMIDWWDWAPTARLFHQAAAARLRDGVLRRDVAGARIAWTTHWMTDAMAIFDRGETEFAAAGKDRDLAIFYLFLTIQECVDLAAHWVADAGWGAPDDAGSTFDVLAERGAIERPLADVLRRATALRNRIAPGYAMLDYARVRAEAKEGVPALKGFLAAVARQAGL